MLTLSEYKSSMDKLNKLDINPYVRVRKGSKVDGKEQALVYLDQRDVFSLLNEAFGVGYWQSEEWVSTDGKSVGASIKFPVILLENGTVYTYVYSSVADLIINTKKINNVTVETLAACNIPMVFNGYAVAALDMEEAVKGAASRALVRAATKFMRSIANLYNYKGLFYTANGQKPDLSKINFNAPELGHQDDEEAVIENVTPIVEAPLANEALINQLVEVATQLEKDSKKKMQLVIDTINHIAEELGETPPLFNTSGGLAFKKSLSALVDAEGLTLIIEQLKAKLEPAKPAKASKSVPK